ncbi:TRAP transporter small permease [Enteractinococcus helveticum]|uniref:Tripartite ATP-independent periplasmic transporters DctQ component domain-containing protein n=1 Tax=Enteractinococcus helveticum TaxID=1837282 RepID=A0A1B7M0K4_9MICC|nr:TRAP transporter small permease [Enteractinococcus helveticum]OAV61565.1 hypothetical protein A6F49_09015 [Enteractinococcus helveticum]
MKKLIKGLDTFLTTVVVLMLIGLMLHVVANALGRYFLKTPLDGTNEVVAYWYLPVITLGGFLIAHFRREHISVSLVTDRLRRQNKKEFLIVGRILGMLLSLALAWYGLLEAISSFQVGLTAGVSSLQIWPVMFLVPIVFLALAVTFIVEVFSISRGEHESVQQEAVADDEAIQGS